MSGRKARDSRLLDAVEILPTETYSGAAWRIVREGRDPVQCTAVGGRWDDRTFDVLYTSLHPDGARAEMYFHLSQGQPVMPSRAIYRLHELRIDLTDCIRIRSLDELAALGLKIATYGRLSYSDREQEYPRTQEIAEAAHFHGRKGLIVPSARSDHFNLVVFCKNREEGYFEAVRDCGVVDWARVRTKP
jgi:RES domain-containing protein